MSPHQSRLKQLQKPNWPKYMMPSNQKGISECLWYRILPFYGEHQHSRLLILRSHRPPPPQRARLGLVVHSTAEVGAHEHAHGPADLDVLVPRFRKAQCICADTPCQYAALVLSLDIDVHVYLYTHTRLQTYSAILVYTTYHMKFLQYSTLNRIQCYVRAEPCWS